MPASCILGRHRRPLSVVAAMQCYVSYGHPREEGNQIGHVGIRQQRRQTKCHVHVVLNAMALTVLQTEPRIHQVLKLTLIVPIVLDTYT